MDLLRWLNGLGLFSRSRLIITGCVRFVLAQNLKITFPEIKAQKFIGQTPCRDVSLFVSTPCSLSKIIYSIKGLPRNLIGTRNGQHCLRLDRSYSSC